MAFRFISRQNLPKQLNSRLYEYSAKTFCSAAQGQAERLQPKLIFRIDATSDKKSDSNPGPTGPEIPIPKIETATATLDKSPKPAEDDNFSKYNLTPKQIVAELDRYIVGQQPAKKAVAIALRNRWRRQQLDPKLRQDIMPKNILMIGPTGVGKAEIARRLAKLVDAPFVKTEASKYTEVGFHGKDVDTIVRDLVEVAISLVKESVKTKKRKEVEAGINKKILDLLVGPHASASTRDVFTSMLDSGLLEQREVTIEMPAQAAGPRTTPLGRNMGIAIELSSLQDILGAKGSKQEKRMTVKEARAILLDQELEQHLSQETLAKLAIERVENEGIVFIDEIDKIATSEHKQSDASTEGVQRDLLPLIEGTTIDTKYGKVNTDFILFIASGAFHHVKPSDLLAELQGRLPIRVELHGLGENELRRILTEPENNLIRQQIALLHTEGIELVVTDGAIKRMAHLSAEFNTSVENIGGRRLHTVVERVVEELSFNAPDMERGSKVVIDEKWVDKRMKDLLKRTDLTKYII